MDLKEAQDLILQVVENPTKPVSPDLAVAVATVLVRNELLGASPSQITLNVFSYGEN